MVELPHMEKPFQQLEADLMKTRNVLAQTQQENRNLRKQVADITALLNRWDRERSAYALAVAINLPVTGTDSTLIEVGPFTFTMADKQFTPPPA